VTEGQFSDGIKKEFTSKDIRYTLKGSKLYASVLRCAEDGNYALTMLGDKDAKIHANFKGIIRDVTLLGSDEKPVWKQDETALHISSSYQSNYPIVFEITID
jgi:alpha-L-fucosidase